MPKLSQQTLEKRFQCQHCGETVRTRQGLSGHIQFKHSSEAKQKQKSFYKTILVVAEQRGLEEQDKRSNKQKEEDLSDVTRICIDWTLVKNTVECSGVKFNDNDFKNYLIVSLAQMQANKRLYQELATDLGEAMAEGFTRLAGMIKAIPK